MSSIYTLLAAGALMFLVIGGLSLLAHHYTLGNIKSRTVGDGQHGVARFATAKEIKQTYKHIPFEAESWRNGKNLPTEQGLIVGCTKDRHGKVAALVDTGDVHALMIGAAGVGKTAYFLYPNIEFACASGMSFISSDTKGDLARNYAAIAKNHYGYDISILDLRNPTRSDGNNLLHLVNRYMDIYLADKSQIAAKAKAEKYAKIIAKTIIGTEGMSMGQNAYFYDSAEGLLAAVILLVSEYLPPIEIEGTIRERRHIVSVFKMVQDLLEPSQSKGKNQFQLLMQRLPSTHKAKWLAGAALNSSEQGMASVLSTVLSKLNAFLDSELEQVLCFDTELDAESFCKNKSAVFLILPEEDPVKYFMISLFLQQFYRELLAVADEHGGQLPRRVMIFADEIGTIPAIDSFEMMLSAGRSRRISVVPIIQSLAQLEQNYGKEGAEIITDNCQLTIFGGFAPNSQTAEKLSKAMGNRTVLSGSVSRGKKDPSQSLQMMERPLMTADELKSIPKGHFIVMKTGTNPMRTRLRLFLEWGIRFEEPYVAEDRSERKVYYADKAELEKNIAKDSSVLAVASTKSTKSFKKGGVQDAHSHEQSKSNNPQNSSNPVKKKPLVIDREVSHP